MTSPVPAGGKPAVLFDLDGTLVDTNYLHVVAWWEAFRVAGHDVAMTDIHRRIGMGAEVLTESLLGTADEAMAEAHLNHYLRYLDQLRPFPGATDLLRACREHGLQVVFASSGGKKEVTAITAALQAEDLADVVTSSSDAEGAKPEPDILQVAMDRAGVPAQRAVMVGDTVWDVESSKRAGVPCVGVLTGGLGRAELVDAGAVAVYRDVAEILASFADTPLGKLAIEGG